MSDTIKQHNLLCETALKSFEFINSLLKDPSLYSSMYFSRVVVLCAFATTILAVPLVERAAARTFAELTIRQVYLNFIIFLEGQRTLSEYHYSLDANRLTFVLSSAGTAGDAEAKANAKFPTPANL